MALILGPAFGPLAGGFLTDNFSWNWIFDVNLLPGATAAVLIVWLLRDPVKPQRPKIDWYGVGLLALGLGSLQFMLDNGERVDWFSDPLIATAGVLCVACLSVFAWWQWSGTKNPVVDLHVLRFRGVAVGALIALAFGAIIFAPAIITPIYASSVLGYTSFDSGMLLAMRALPVIILTPVFATMAEKGFDVRYLLGPGFALAAGSIGWLAFGMTSNTPFAMMAIPLFISGIAQSMLLVPLIVGVLSTTPAELNGKISPIITLCVQLGGSIATATSIAFFDRRMAFHSDVLSASITLHRDAINNVQPTHATLLQLMSLVTQQASTLGFADTMLAVSVLAAIAVPIVFVFPRSQAASGVSAH
jgi:DHA2 family multidrug resistance protein